MKVGDKVFIDGTKMTRKGDGYVIEAMRRIGEVQSLSTWDNEICVRWEGEPKPSVHHASDVSLLHPFARWNEEG